MAKRRKKHFKRSHKRGQMGALSMGAFDIQGILGAAVGGVGGKFLNKVIPDSIDKRIAAGGKMLIGALLPMLAKHQAAVKGAGLGLVAIGATELLTEIGVLSGIGVPASDATLAVAIEGIEDVEFSDVSEDVSGDVLAGDVLAGDDIPVINGDDIPVINGDDQY